MLSAIFLLHFEKQIQQIHSFIFSCFFLPKIVKKFFFSNVKRECFSSPLHFPMGFESPYRSKYLVFKESISIWNKRKKHSKLCKVQACRVPKTDFYETLHVWRTPHGDDFAIFNYYFGFIYPPWASYRRGKTKWTCFAS